MAGIVGTLPYSIANGQAIDAGPVQANFNWIMNQVNANAASLAAANTFALAQTAAVAGVEANLVTAGQVRNDVNYGADSGVADAYVCSPNIPCTAYASGQEFVTIPANTSTLTNPTLKISALAALPITNKDGSVLLAGQIKSGFPYRFIVNSSATGFYVEPVIQNTFPSKLPTITATVAANALTIGVSPQFLDFRSATLASGAVTTLPCSPASVTVGSSITLGMTNGVAAKIAVAVINNAGTAEIAIANMAGLVIDESQLITTTVPGNSAATWYSTAARTNVAFRVVGYVNVTYQGGVGWSTAPSEIQGASFLSWIGNFLGQNQSYSAPTRLINTIYQNLSGRPILVLLSINLYNVTMNAYCDATSSPTFQVGFASDPTTAAGTRPGFIAFVVPVNFYYKVTGASPSLWTELS